MKTKTVKRNSRRKDKSKIAFFCAFCLPSLLLYLLFCIYPILNSAYVSLFNWSGYGERTAEDFVGLTNYLSIIHDSEFLAAIKNDFLIIFGKEIIIVLLTILFAVSLTRLRFRKAETGIYRFLFFLPNVLSTIVIAIVWNFVLDAKFGILTPLMEKLGLEKYVPQAGWNFEHPIGVITFVASWCGVGLFMLVMISAISSVSAELYESAVIDGAGQWQQLRYITMPAVWRQTQFMVITILYQSFSANFSMIQAMMGDAVNEKNVVMGMFVYKNSFDSLFPQVGYSYAAAIIMLVITVTISLAANKLMTRGQDDGE